VKQALEKTIALAPEHADAQIALGSFHAAVIGHGGRLMTHLQGADTATGARMYPRALKLDPASVIARLEAARGLVILEAEARRQVARNLLASAAAAAPRDAMERLDVEAARAELKKGSAGRRALVRIPRGRDADKELEMSEVTWYRWDEMPKERVNDFLDRRLITGERMMLAHVYLKKGCVVPRHRHENEQLTYILEGRLRFWIGEDEAKIVDVAAGEVLAIPSNVWHKAEALADTLDVDVFSPPREDWLARTDDYLRR
jgi:quercetin dioxygenase-like cupin family protein